MFNLRICVDSAAITTYVAERVGRWLFTSTIVISFVYCSLAGLKAWDKYYYIVPNTRNCIAASENMN